MLPRILELPGPKNFIIKIIDSIITDGLCIVYQISKLNIELKRDQFNQDNLIEHLKDRLEKMGKETKILSNKTDKIEVILSEGFGLEHKPPLKKIATDEFPELEDKIALIEIQSSTNIDIKKHLVDLNTFWKFRKEANNKPISIIYLIPEISPEVDINNTLKDISYSQIIPWTNFKRIDKLIWALLHLKAKESEQPINFFAEALALEIGDQNLKIIREIASIEAQFLKAPKNFIFQKYPDECEEELERKIWRSQVRAFLPWIEECRLKFITKYKEYLVIDEEQKKRRVEKVEDIEICSLKYQFSKKNCLETVPEKDLIHSLCKLRNSLAHLKVCNSDDFTTALNSLAKLKRGNASYF